MTVLIFILLLGVLVLVHEAGHFLAAKLFRVGVEEFAFGFPPRIASVKKQGTAFSINAIPIGGYVKIKGENGDNSDPDSFQSKSKWKRATILFAGVFMNVVLGFVLLGVGFTAGTPSVLEGLPADAQVTERTLRVVSVSDSSPASEAGIASQDEIIAVQDVPVATVDDFRSLVQPQIGSPVAITLSREGAKSEVSVTPVANEEGLGIIGVGLVETGTVKYPFFSAIREAGRMTGSVLAQIVTAFWTLIRNLFISQPVSLDVAGPVGIAVLTGQVAKLGFIYILQFAALLSLNLAVINILPIPALDGGRLLFLGIESIRRKPVSHKVEATIHSVGFALLIGVVIYVTVIDVSRFSTSISSFLQRIF